MSEQIQKIGILTQPVEFQFGAPLPPHRGGDIGDPQNLWYTIDMNQRWVAGEVLGLGGPDPYKEPDENVIASHSAEVADTKRADGIKYTDQRGLDSFAAILGVSDEDAADEFRGKTVLDIGSGAGKFSDDLRREAGAHVTELDFSSEALSNTAPVPESQGSRVLADGTELPFEDSSFDATVSMYSASLHTERVRDRLTALTEMLRVTKEGGRAFVVPLFSGPIMRQQRWFRMHDDPNLKRDLQQDPDMQAYERNLRQDAAMDYALTKLLRTLIVRGNVEFSPVLATQEIGGHVYDGISGVFKVNNKVTKDKTDPLIDGLVREFSHSGR